MSSRPGLFQAGAGGEEKQVELVVVGETNARLDLVEDADVGVGDKGIEVCAKRVLSARPKGVAWRTRVDEDEEMEEEIEAEAACRRGREETLDRGIRENSPT
jgi:hypothetical protein